MQKNRANLVGIIGPRNLASITTFVKCSNTNARLIEEKSDYPYLYSLQFDFATRHELRANDQVFAILYSYGGTHNIGYFLQQPHNLIQRTARPPQGPWSVDGREMVFALKEEQEDALIYEGSPADSAPC